MTRGAWDGGRGARWGGSRGGAGGLGVGRKQRRGHERVHHTSGAIRGAWYLRSSKSYMGKGCHSVSSTHANRTTHMLVPRDS